jgi:hypothetical protein
MTETNIELTPEIKAKLKKFMGFTKDPVFTYVPKIFRKEAPANKEVWPLFQLKGKDGIESAQSEDEASYVDPKTQNIHFTLGSQRIQLLSKHIVGWKNFKDEEGNEIPFQKDGDKASMESLKYLRPDLQVELQNAINEQLKLSVEELQGLES